MRDLFEGDSGTLRAWGVASQKAVCDIDTTPPDTSISGFAGQPEQLDLAEFRLRLARRRARPSSAGSTPARYEPCSSPKTFSGLGSGSHTFRVRAVDGSDNEDATPAEYSWVVDTTDAVAPVVSLTAPASGAVLRTPRPRSTASPAWPPATRGS